MLHKNVADLNKIFLDRFFDFHEKLVRSRSYYVHQINKMVAARSLLRRADYILMAH